MTVLMFSGLDLVVWFEIRNKDKNISKIKESKVVENYESFFANKIRKPIKLAF